MSCFSVGSLSASAGKCGNLHHSALIFPNHWSWVMNNLVGSEFHFFWELEMLEFCAFHGFLSKFSAWSHKLKWSFRILCPSVTGKMQNLRKIHVFCKNWTILWCITDTLEGSKQVHCGTYGKLSENALLISLKEKAGGFPPLPKEMIDSGDCGITFDFLPTLKYRFTLLLLIFLFNINRYSVTLFLAVRI